MAELSVLIPARNEEWLAQTIRDAVAHMEGDTEIIAVLDGRWAEPPIQDNPRVHLVYHNRSVGQRAGTNEAAAISTAKWVMKADAHCAFDQGFDVKLMEPYKAGELGPDVTTVPRMFNLHVFDWVCRCGNRTYQGARPERCGKCGGAEFEREVVWKPRLNRRTDFARFDHELHFQYWGSYEKRKEAKDQGDLADLMCFVGACWMMTRDRYWEIGGCDEKHGSWGQQGVEMACKSWLSGGRVVVNKRTWFAHLFRTQPGFGFPYQMSGGDVERARKHSRALWFGNTWEKQTRPLDWLLEKFAPVPGWHEAIGAEALAKAREAGRMFYAECAGGQAQLGRGAARDEQTKQAKRAGQAEQSAQAGRTARVGPSVGIVYYTDYGARNGIQDGPLFRIVQKQIKRCVGDWPIVSVSLRPLPVEFGRNIVLDRQRGILTMFKQILSGLEALDTEIVFFAEHDVLYHKLHYAFRPESRETFYYDRNVWKVDAAGDGRALFYLADQTAQLCAWRELLVEHYRKRIAKVEKNASDMVANGEPVRRDGYSRHMGFEPGKHSYPRGVDNYPFAFWMSPFPSIDVRHTTNLTPSRWSRGDFRDKRTCEGWKEADDVPGWGRTRGRWSEFLLDVDAGLIPV